MGKSAQFPLHVWLPDAMEGPTPVSALIHAATMVNAGVYLVARTNPIFAHAPGALVVVGSIGIFTAILAASIAMTQTDIKRVLAYSTLSQLGYMFAALGVGAFTAAIFHLITHGFFKGLLFLGSGSVIHAVHEEQDMRRMGGLAKKIPITYTTMLIGSLAIAGIPPLAGFFSKDEILGEAFKLGFQWIWAIGLFVALLTAFYMFRLMGLTFWGKSRVDPQVEPNIHESPPVMTWPLIILAVPSIFAGSSWACRSGPGSSASGWRRSSSRRRSLLGHEEASFQLFGIDGALIMASVAVAAIGVALAWRLFGAEIGRIRVAAKPDLVRSYSARVPFLYRASLNKWWFDELNNLLFIVIGGRVANFLWWFDRRVVDDTVNDLAKVTVGAGRDLRRIQTGRVQNYALGHRDRADRHGRLVPPDRGPLTMSISSIPILTLVTFLPLIGALVVAVAPERYARGLALATALATWILSLLLLIGFISGGDRGQLFQFVVAAPWIPAFGIQFKLGVDGLSLILVVLTTTLSWIAILSSFAPIKDRDQALHDVVPHPRGRPRSGSSSRSTCSSSTSSGRSSSSRCT